MSRGDMLDAIRESICSKVEIEERGIDRYVIHTDFTYPDGDELRIVLKKQDGEWILTDEGHTLMWLSYDDLNPYTESRKNLFARTLASNHAEDADGRICIRFKPDGINAAIHSMIQVLIQTADLIYTDRESVRNTFIEDMQARFCAGLKERRFETNKILKNKKGENYSVDIYVEGGEPILVFAVNNKDRCQEATFAIITLAAEDEMEFTSMIVIDENAEIPQNVRDRAISRADKTFVGLDAMEEGLPRFFEKNRCIET